MGGSRINVNTGGPFRNEVKRIRRLALGENVLVVSA